MKPIPADTCTKAWVQATEHLQSLGDWRDYTLILEIAEPMQLPPEDKRVYELVDTFLSDRAAIRLSTVINTIFPATLYARYGANGVFKEYRRLWPRIKKHAHCRQWGTYADRIIRGTKLNGESAGPLKHLIEKLRKQLATASPKRAIYELNTLDSPNDIPIYCEKSDSNFIMGGPCLSHLSFKLTADRRLMLTALYRSHYYVQRALGNLYGLAWLQFFVASELKIKTAELVCLSTMAQLDTLSAKPKSGVKGWGVREVEALLAQCSRTINTNGAIA
jgi:hypothetical protein